MAILDFIAELLSQALLLNFCSLVGDDLELGKGAKDGLVKLLHVEYAQLAPDAETPEQLRDRQVDLPVVDDGLGHNRAAEAEDLVDLLHGLARERL